MTEPLPETPETALSATQALCPVCLRRLPAHLVMRGQGEKAAEVWLTRVCPEHGPCEAVIWRGAPEFASWRRPKTPSTPPSLQTNPDQGCPFDCGLCAEHGQHTCTAVLEVTARCNLRCPVCYASAGETHAPDPPLNALAERLRLLRRDAGACNLQLSGGEPTLREDLPQLIALARPLGFGLVQLNTNGLRLGAEPGYAETLASAGLQSVFLQFDGSDAASQVLRGRPLQQAKLDALDACARAGLGVVLVPTLLRGVNDQLLGDILRLALSRAPTVRGVHFQPAATFGRFAPEQSEERRLTLPEVLSLLVEQSQGQLRAQDFHPPCCEHERCSFSARFAVQGGRLAPILEGGCCESGPLQAAEGARRAKASVAGQWAAAPQPFAAQPLGNCNLKGDDFERFLAERGAHKRFSISCMAFQDAASLDIERVRGCCIHTQAPDGRLIPFCLYNLTAADGTPLYRSAP
ncbi:MAG TPA: radical SAM protein [Humidesulfovibrio sp.]|uniref:radical SAM (seleno)protein TrsS n=1 Tax=Humidesulfovibrio sp. TaxID=2910988 RepID=UPI002C07335B|nr:radical SAM (seleno)protein TrsS [Humidesulfovibrio sp.]HWR03726.1 radical SAM protein [Humidesulfovibrio sp.]